MKVGSLPWLVRHELRLTWRDLTVNIAGGTLIALGIGLLVVVHLILWYLLGGIELGFSDTLPPLVVIFTGVALAVAFPLMVTYGINRSVTVFYERGDLDLLASSPLPARTIFASRVLSVAVALFVMFLLVVVPVGGVGIVAGAPRLLGAYPLAVALALTAASVGMLVTLALVKLLGARRARVVAQLLAALAGVGFFLLSQIPAILGRGESDLGPGTFERIAPLFEEGAILGSSSLVWLPARALFFDPVAVVTVLAAAAALTWLTVVTLQGVFMTGSGETATATPRRRAPQGSLRFRQAGFGRLVLTKEWRLVLRDPYLLGHVLLQAVYLIPLLLLLPRGGTGIQGLDVTAGMAAVTVMMASAIVSALVRITVAGEEAPDLLATAPVPRSTIVRLKLTAALAPVLILAVVPMVLVALQRPLLGLLAAVGLLAGTFSTAFVVLWNPPQGTRADLFKRKSQGRDPVLTFLEGLVPLLWTAAVGFIGSGYMWAWSLPVAALAAMGAAYAHGWRARQPSLNPSGIISSPRS